MFMYYLYLKRNITMKPKQRLQVNKKKPYFKNKRRNCTSFKSSQSHAFIDISSSCYEIRCNIFSQSNFFNTQFSNLKSLFSNIQKHRQINIKYTFELLSHSIYLMSLEIIGSSGSDMSWNRYIISNACSLTEVLLSCK